MTTRAAIPRTGVVYVIQQHGSPASFYSSKVAAALGSQHGWSGAVKVADTFPTQAAAQAFADKETPKMSVQIVARKM